MPPDAVPGIAQVIVDIWQQTKPNLDKIVTERVNGVASPTAIQQATDAINAADPKFKLWRVEIITEDEHDAGYTTEDVTPWSSCSQTKTASKTPPPAQVFLIRLSC
jgi:hypothetical protein